MSKTSTPVDERLFAYLATKTIQEDDYLAGLRIAAAKAGLPEIHIAPEQAAYLQLQMRAINAMNVVEVGTLGGYSAISMARGIPAAGRVITLELERSHAEFAREWVAKSDQAGKIEVRIGDAAKTMADLPDDSTDAVFLDANKSGYVTYMRQALRLLRPGGILLADNVLASGHVADGNGETEVAIRAFLDAAMAAPNLQSVIVPLGDGIFFGVKSD
ncbi:MAG: putative O-methyltransferase YrrM [Planctomycetota bacterium]|jgi:predicted O-methyltransferase YrrM